MICSHYFKAKTGSKEKVKNCLCICCMALSILFENNVKCVNTFVTLTFIFQSLSVKTFLNDGIWRGFTATA